MADQAIFKSQTFGGFNKDEVLRYIDKMSTDYSTEREKLEFENSELRKENDEKNAKILETEGKLNELQAKYDEIMEAYEELRQHYLMLKEHSDNIDAENEKLSGARLALADSVKTVLQNGLNLILVPFLEQM